MNQPVHLLFDGSKYLYIGSEKDNAVYRFDTTGSVTAASPRQTWHTRTVSAAALADRRVVNLPGLCVTPAEMLDSLERLGGAAARQRVRVEIDPHTARIVGTWPGAFDVSRPLSLGFAPEGDIDSIVAQFMAEPGSEA